MGPALTDQDYVYDEASGEWMLIGRELIGAVG
jgi:hypothetical protein